MSEDSGSAALTYLSVLVRWPTERWFAKRRSQEMARIMAEKSRS